MTENHFPTPYGDFTIGIKVGLALGAVEWGILADADGVRHTYYFRGKGVTAYADAEHEANNGDLVLTTRVCEQVKGWVTVSPTNVGETHFRVNGVGDGLPVPEEVPAFPPRIAETAAFFPDQLVTQTISGEFRQILNLFISLPGQPAIDDIAEFMRA